MKVLIATPAYGGQVTEAYFQSILALVHAGYARGIQIDIMTLTNESLITRARNDITARFLAGDWTDLLWIDADIRFTPEHVFRLLEAPYEVCATPYPMKALDWERMARTSGGPDELRAASTLSVVNAAPDAPREGAFIKALDAGTGFLRTTRSALERLVAAHPELEYQTDTHGQTGKRWAIFDTMLADGRYLSEDYAFCRRWQAIGGEVWADIEAPTLGHQGSYTFGK